MPRSLTYLAGSLVTAFMLILAMPPYDIGLLAWFGLVPLIGVLSGRKIWQAALLGQLCGMTFFVGIFTWILKVNGYTLVHHIILALYLGSYFAVFGLLFSVVEKSKGPGVALIAAPFIWVALEFIRANFFFLALPWGLLGHSQYLNLPAIQVADLGGVYLVSFIVVSANIAVYAVIVTLLCTSRRDFQHRSVYGIVLFVGFILAGTLSYGKYVISEPNDGDTLRLSVVQGNIEQQKKWDRQFAHEILDIYTELSKELATEKPDLIVWPETATPGSLRDGDIRKAVGQVTKSTNARLVLGSSDRVKFSNQEKPGYSHYNSAYIVLPDQGRQPIWHYRKNILFPFYEYLPLRDTFPWHLLNVELSHDYYAGRDQPVYSMNGFNLGVAICWETLFPGLIRKFVLNGAQLMINVANESFFGPDVAPYQFLSMNVFRAVENKVCLVRCANTGISCFIDRNGRIYDRVADASGSDTFVRGTRTNNITISRGRTIYSSYGDLFSWCCVFLSVVFLHPATLKSENRLPASQNSQLIFNRKLQ